MKLQTLVWRELFERKSQLVTSFIAILLGITVIVSIENVTHFSERAVAEQMDALGANILILPKAGTLEDYYTADMQSGTLPEEYVMTLLFSDIEGVNNLVPKFSTEVEIGEKPYTLTGILPKSEFQEKVAWGGTIGVFGTASNHVCESQVPGSIQHSEETAVRRKVVDELGKEEVLLGAETARTLNLSEGDSLKLGGRTFLVAGTMPETGTIDDSRVFTHMHTVQEMAGVGAVMNAIEIVGCCKQITEGMVQKLETLLPEAKVVTISQVVQTQVNTNQMMASLSTLLLCIILLVGGASIANYMYANVFERRREIGTLMALGAGSSVVLRIFLMKAALLGLAGGIGGFIAGTLLAMVLGPQLTGVAVMPMPFLLLWAIGLSILVALAASYFPARKAAHLDPYVTFQEV